MGTIFTITEMVKIHAGLTKQEPKIIYRYIPRTLKEELEDPIPVSDIFETMFSQPSPWVGSIRTYDRRKQEEINKYFEFIKGSPHGVQATMISEEFGVTERFSRLMIRKSLEFAKANGFETEAKAKTGRLKTYKIIGK